MFVHEPSVLSKLRFCLLSILSASKLFKCLVGHAAVKYWQQPMLKLFLAWLSRRRIFKSHADVLKILMIVPTRHWISTALLKSVSCVESLTSTALFGQIKAFESANVTVQQAESIPVCTSCLFRMHIKSQL